MATIERFVSLVTQSALNVERNMAVQMGEDLHTRYTEPQRHYHTLLHLDAMLASLDARAAGVDDKIAIELATWFHDCVYDPVRGAPYNENESIVVWERFVHDTSPALAS